MSHKTEEVEKKLAFITLSVLQWFLFTMIVVEISKSPPSFDRRYISADDAADLGSVPSTSIFQLAEETINFLTIFFIMNSVYQKNLSMSIKNKILCILSITIIFNL